MSAFYIKVVYCYSSNSTNRSIPLGGPDYLGQQAASSGRCGYSPDGRSRPRQAGQVLWPFRYCLKHWREKRKSAGRAERSVLPGRGLGLRAQATGAAQIGSMAQAQRIARCRTCPVNSGPCIPALLGASLALTSRAGISWPLDSLIQFHPLALAPHPPGSVHPTASTLQSWVC